jgi:tryptophanyl-tRNA synthetase
MTQWKVRDEPRDPAGFLSRYGFIVQGLIRKSHSQSKMQLGDDASLDSPTARKSLKHGLFSYPILQAADILLYRTTHVPVGEDQRQHLEFARECVTNFNHTYKTDVLVAPQTLVSPSKRIMSLTNPLQKMSKSEPSPKSRILFTDEDEDIKRKIRRAVTDSNDLVTYEPKTRPGVANLIEILASFDPQNRSASQLATQMRGHKVSELKEVVSQVVCGEVAEIRDRYQYFMGRDDVLQETAFRGMRGAKNRAKPVITAVSQAVGLDKI